MNPFGDIIKTYAEKNPKGIAVYYGTKRKETWKELNDRVNSLANVLYDLGIRKGDKGIVMFHNSPEFMESVRALEKLGAISVPMNYRFVSKEIEYQTKHSDSKVFLTEDLWLEDVRKARPNMPKVENYIVSGESGEFLNYEDSIKKYPSKEPEVDTGMDDVCSIWYTGGTTGTPKGTVHTYAGCITTLEGVLGAALKGVPQTKIPKLRLPIPFSSSIAEIIGSDFTNDLIHRPTVQKILADPSLPKIIINRILPILRGRLPFLELPFLSSLPLFHSANFMVWTAIWLAGMGSIPFVVQTNPRFDPKEILEILDKVKPIALALVPTMWVKLLEHPDIDKYDFSRVAVVGSGAGICTGDLKKRVFERFPRSVFADGFGQTEMGPVVTWKFDTSAQVDKIKDRSVGVSLSTVGIRVVNERGEDMKPGETGEIIYKGETMMNKYYKDEERTSALIKDGWFYSGDLGYFDADGELFVVDRKGEIISTGGEKIYPHEVEEILESNPKVEYSCLMGIPDETYGKIPVGLIKLIEGEEATEDEIIDWCRDKMSGFKRPRFVVFVDEFPLNPVGKVLRREGEERFKGEIEEGYERWKKKQR